MECGESGDMGEKGGGGGGKEDDDEKKEKKKKGEACTLGIIGRE